MNSTNVDEYWVGVQGMTTLSIWPSLNSPENELAYGDFPSGLLLMFVKGLELIGIDRGLFDFYIISYRVISVLALIGIYVILINYPNDFDSILWKTSSTLVYLLALVLINDVNTVAKPDALSLFFLSLFLYAINPRSKFQQLESLKSITIGSFIGGMLISTKFFGLILLPFTLVVLAISFKVIDSEKIELKRTEVKLLIVMTLILPSIAGAAFVSRLVLLGEQRTNEYLTIKWANVSFGSQQAYSYHTLLTASASMLILVACISVFLFKKRQVFGISERLLATIVFTIPISFLINLDGIMTFRFFKSLYFFQVKTSNGHFVREKNPWELSVFSWNRFLLIMILIALIGLYLGNKKNNGAYLFEIVLFLLVIVFFATRAVSKTYLFPLMPFIVIGLIIFTCRVSSRSNLKLLSITSMLLGSILLMLILLSSQVKVIQPERYNPKVAIGMFLDGIGDSKDKVYADAEIFVPYKFNQLTTSWAGTWDDAKDVDFLLLSGVLIDAYGAKRSDSDVVINNYRQSYEFYSKALNGTNGYCKVGKWENKSSYSILLSRKKEFCDNLKVVLK
jgi:hypothetical protein